MTMRSGIQEFEKKTTTYSKNKYANNQMNWPDEDEERNRRVQTNSEHTGTRKKLEGRSWRGSAISPPATPKKPIGKSQENR